LFRSPFTFVSAREIGNPIVSSFRIWLRDLQKSGLDQLNIYAASGGFSDTFNPRRNVAFWHQADIEWLPLNVRLVENSGHNA
jgi:hypothetical protein